MERRINMAGLLSLNTKIGYKSGAEASTYTDIPNLTEVPEIGGSPGESGRYHPGGQRKAIYQRYQGLRRPDFKFLYDNASEGANYRIVKGLETAGTLVDWQVSLPDGTAFAFSGYPTVKLDSVSVGAALYFTVSIALNSDVTVTNPSAGGLKHALYRISGGRQSPKLQNHGAGLRGHGEEASAGIPSAYSWTALPGTSLPYLTC